MSGHIPRENSLATVIDRVEDLRDAVQAQTAGLYKMVEAMEGFEARLEKVEEALTAEGDGKLADLLESLVTADRSHAAALQDLRHAIERLMEAVTA